MDSESIITLGWREYVALPDLGLPAIRAKLDTGARTSALHAFRLERFRRKGAPWVRFWIHPLRKHREIEHQTEAEVVDRRVVSDSGGHRQRRLVVVTRVGLGSDTWPVEVTLTNRDRMLFPMLLGRTAMEGRIMVDPSASYTLGREAGRAFRTALLNDTLR